MNRTISIRESLDEEYIEQIDDKIIRVRKLKRNVRRQISIMSKNPIKNQSIISQLNIVIAMYNIQIREIRLKRDRIR